MNKIASNNALSEHHEYAATRFIDLLRLALKTRAWQELHSDIKNRLGLAESTRTLRYIGTMQWVYCSPIGNMFATLLRPLALLPNLNRRDCQFEFIIRRERHGLLKQRRYFLHDKNPFTFRSLFLSQPKVHEQFAMGLGMNLSLSADSDCLLFHDNEYFIRLGRWRVPIPRWLSVGRFELSHRNIDARHFQVIIRIAHPIFGTLFYQRGEFLRF